MLSQEFRATVRELGIIHKLIPIRRPQRNGKVERFNRTLLEQWAYFRAYTSNEE